MNYGLLGLMKGYVEGNNVLRAQGIQDQQLAAEQTSRGLNDQLMQDKINSDASDAPLQTQALQNQVNQQQAMNPLTLQAAQNNVTVSAANAANAPAAALAHVNAMRASADEAQRRAAADQADTDFTRLKMTEAQGDDLTHAVVGSSGLLMQSAQDANADPGVFGNYYNQLAPKQAQISAVKFGPVTQNPTERALTYTGPNGPVSTTFGAWLAKGVTYGVGASKPLVLAAGAKAFNPDTGAVVASNPKDSATPTTNAAINSAVTTSLGGSGAIGLPGSAQGAYTDWTGAGESINQVTQGRYAPGAIVSAMSRVSNNGQTPINSPAGRSAVLAELQANSDAPSGNAPGLSAKTNGTPAALGINPTGTGNTPVPVNAPPSAVALLKVHPELAPQFKAKYGYLPQ